MSNEITFTLDEDLIFWEYRVAGECDATLWQDGAPTKDIGEMLEILKRALHNIKEIAVVGKSICMTYDPWTNGSSLVMVEYRPVPESIRESLLERYKSRMRENMIAWLALEQERLQIDIPKAEDEY